MSMYKQFKTDANLEKAGIDIDYGDFVIKIARAGGANKRFARIMEEKMKPVRRAMQTETLENARAEALLREAYADGVVLLWSVLVVADEKGKPLEPVQLAGTYREEHGKDAEHTTLIKGIEGPSGDVLPFTVENVAATFKALPDLFTDIREQAGKVGLFREQGQEADAGN
mgnify:CR=1 FL=1